MITEFISYKPKLRFMKGVSPLIAMVLVIAFGFAAMTIVLAVVNPMLDRARDSGIVNEATQNMQLLDSAIKAVASEARGSKRTVHIKITEGVLRTNATAEQVYLEYEPKARTILDGFSGDIKIESRPIFLEYFNRYSDNNNANDTWTAVNGSWSISSGRFLGTGGIAFKNIGGNLSGFDLAASIVRSSAPDGQVYVVPGNPRDLVLYLPFDGNVNTSETTAYDYSAYKNNGTLLNGTSATCFTNNACPSWVGGRFGNSSEFDGIGDWVNISSNTSFNRNAGTIGLWIKFPYAGSTNPGVQMFFQSQNSSDQVGTRFALGRGSFNDACGTCLFFDTKDGGNKTSYDISSWLADSWHYVAFVWNSTNMSIYTDGVFRSSASYLPISYFGQTNEMGRNLNSNYLNGTMDEFMIFNRDLSANEVVFLYESSIKKITTAGEIPTISEDANVTIVLASPSSSYFDNIKLKSGPLKIRFVVPYQNIDIVNQTRFGPGDHNIVIRHYGTNTTSNRPMIGVEE